jgi:predicted DNA-binding protein (UPF0251 family)
MSREQELEKLTAEQVADDTPRQRPEEHGGGHGQPVLSLEAALPFHASTDLDGMSLPDAGSGTKEGQPKLVGRFVQARVASLWAHVEDADSEAAQVVRKAVESMTDEQRETFRLIFAERVSEREAAERLGISQPAVHSRVETLKRIVTRALVQAAGGDAEALA